MNIFLRIEVLGRELQGRLLLALAAAERGHHVVLLDNGTAARLTEHRPRLPIGYFHDNSPGQAGGKTVMHDALASRGWLITGQDEEHGLTTDDFDRDMGGRFPTIAMANKTAMFAFGPYDAEGIRRDCPEHAEKVVPTGSPRMDFWRTDFARYYEHYGRPPGVTAGPFLLVLMSSSPFFAEGPRMSFTGAEGSAAELSRRVERLAATGLDTELVAAYRRVVHQKLAVEAIARQHPGLQVVYRPHPHELLGAWQEVFEDAPANVRVIRDNASGPWVRHARCVVFGGSTVGFEAAFAGVPVISFQPDGYDRSPAVSRMGHRATAVSELVPLVDAILAGAEPELPAARAAAMQETLVSRFFAMEGHLAADRIVDTWEALATTAVRAAPPIRPADVGRVFTPKSIARTARDATVEALSLGSPEQRLRRRADRALLDLKFPRFDLEEVLRIHRALIGGLDRFADVRITQVRPRVLHLTADGSKVDMLDPAVRKAPR